MTEIKKVGIESIDLVPELAQKIWPQTYRTIISPEQLDYMLKLLYSKDALSRLVTDLQQQFIIAFENNSAVGFACYSQKINNNNHVFRLHKLYLLPDLQGKGIGKKLLQFIVEEIKTAGASFLELNVNRHNPAINFYKKNGFEILHEEDIAIGNGFFMNDYVMQKALF